MGLIGAPVLLAKLAGQGIRFERIGRTWHGGREATLSCPPFGEDVRDRTGRVVDRRGWCVRRARFDLRLVDLGQAALMRARVQQTRRQRLNTSGQLDEPWVTRFQRSLLRLDGAQDLEVPNQAIGRRAQIFGNVGQFDLGM